MSAPSPAADQAKLLERSRQALVQINHDCCDDAAGVIHDLMREVNRLQDQVDQLTRPKVSAP